MIDSSIYAAFTMFLALTKFYSLRIYYYYYHLSRMFTFSLYFKGPPKWQLLIAHRHNAQSGKRSKFLLGQQTLNLYKSSQITGGMLLVSGECTIRRKELQCDCECYPYISTNILEHNRHLCIRSTAPFLRVCSSDQGGN